MYLILYLKSLFTIFITDHILCNIINNKARWFQLHFVINMFICHYSFPEMLEILYDVNKSNEYTTNLYSKYLGLNLHIYHTIFFKLKKIDIYHHVSSVFITFIATIFFSKKILSIYYFFFTGLPGGIDYFLLTLYKNNYIKSITEKKYNSLLNAYIRLPGGIISFYLTLNILINFQNNIISFYCGIILLVMAYFNSIYFAKLAIENNIEHKYTNSK